MSHKHTFVEVLPTHNAFPSMHLGNFGEILSTKATGGSERNLSSSHSLAIVAHGPLIVWPVDCVTMHMIGLGDANTRVL
jgi:hypothetical protein